MSKTRIFQNDAKDFLFSSMKFFSLKKILVKIFNIFEII
jgi:hypothetical protein